MLDYQWWEDTRHQSGGESDLTFVEAISGSFHSWDGVFPQAVSSLKAVVKKNAKD
jgi:hypothetical protein